MQACLRVSNVRCLFPIPSEPYFSNSETLSTNQSIFLFKNIYIYLSIHLSICRSMYLSISTFPYLSHFLTNLDRFFNRIPIQLAITAQIFPGQVSFVAILLCDECNLFSFPMVFDWNATFSASKGLHNVIKWIYLMFVVLIFHDIASCVSVMEETYPIAAGARYMREKMGQRQPWPWNLEWDWTP